MPCGIPCRADTRLAGHCAEVATRLRARQLQRAKSGMQHASCRMRSAPCEMSRAPPTSAQPRLSHATARRRARRSRSCNTQRNAKMSRAARCAPHVACRVSPARCTLRCVLHGARRRWPWQWRKAHCGTTMMSTALRDMPMTTPSTRTARAPDERQMLLDATRCRLVRHAA